jgi:hypothetical protein
VTTQPNADVQASMDVGLSLTFGGFSNAIFITTGTGFGMGFDEDAAASSEYELSTSASLGLDVAAELASETPAAMDVGLDLFALVQHDFALQISMAVGFNEAATVSFERDIDAARPLALT